MCRSSGEENCAASARSSGRKTGPGRDTGADDALLGGCRARIVKADASAGWLHRRRGAQQVAFLFLTRAAEPPLALALHLVGHDRGGMPPSPATRMAYTSRSTLPGSSATMPAASLTKATRCSSICRSYFRCTAPEPVIDVVFRLLEQVSKRVRAEGLDVFVRVFCALHLQHAHAHLQLFEDADRALRRLLSRAVVVVGDDDLARVARQQPRLLRRERRAERGDRAVEARLMQARHVDVALCQYDIPAL